MLAKKVSFTFSAILLLTLLACNTTDVGKPDEDALDSLQRTPVCIGQLHNEILTAYAEGHNLFLKKMPKEEAITLLVRCANNVFRKHGINFRADEAFVKTKLSQLKKFGDDSGYSFFNPGTDPEVALQYLEQQGAFSSGGIENLRTCIRILKKSAENPDRLLRLVSKDDLRDGPVIDIVVHSSKWWRDYYQYMNEYVKQHPEALGWWKRWRKRIREWLLIGSDALGGFLGFGGGPGGTALGAAIGSITFSMIWYPY